MFSTDFSSTLTVLSAMITPAVLILATGQLIMTTSQRLARSIERVRKIADQFEEMAKKKDTRINEEKRDLLYRLLYHSANRSRKLQQAMSILYIALSVFVATSVSIGLFEVFDILLLWVPIALGLSGAGLLFYASILLITETRIALDAVEKETGYVLRHYRKDLPLFPQDAFPEEKD